MVNVLGHQAIAWPLKCLPGILCAFQIILRFCSLALHNFSMSLMVN